MFSVPRGDVNHAAREIANVLPPGLKGLTQGDTTTQYERYDKFNAPIMWALWAALYRWVEEGIPMPRAAPSAAIPTQLTGSPATSTGTPSAACERRGSTYRTATYVAKLSDDDPNYAGMLRFSDEKLRRLFGSRADYERRVRAKLDEMVEQGFLLDEDRDLIFPHVRQGS